MSRGIPPLASLGRDDTSRVSNKHQVRPDELRAIKAKPVRICQTHHLSRENRRRLRPADDDRRDEHDHLLPQTAANEIGVKKRAALAEQRAALSPMKLAKD